MAVVNTYRRQFKKSCVPLVAYKQTPHRITHKATDERRK
jgi:hypothetical protein